MKTNRLSALMLMLTLFSFNVIGQTNHDQEFREKFIEANLLMDDNLYSNALSIWKELLQKDPENANINYKIGVCYLHFHGGKDKLEGLKYLEKAFESTTNNYDPYTHTERNSPVETYYYLGKSYHLHYQLDKAIEYLAEFRSQVNDKHIYYAIAEQDIKACGYAKEALKKPVNIEFTSLGTPINNDAPNYSPVLSVDESTIYYTSRELRKDSSNYLVKHEDGEYFEDIYVSYKVDGKWSTPEMLPISSTGHEATVNLSADGQTLFLYKDGEGQGDLYYTNFEGEQWTSPKKLGSNINSDAHETHVATTPDGEELFFISEREGGIGGRDIYFCKKLPTGDWALAQNMGEVLNSKFDEDGIFIHPDGKTMYFSSQGHTSIGGYDIFYSIKDDKGVWGTPVNMGYPINSTGDDVFFVTSADGKRAYYSAIHEDGEGDKDIYVISLKDVEEKPLTLLTGKVDVCGGERDNITISVFSKESGSQIGLYKPRSNDGKFAIILQPNNDYHIVYKSGEYIYEEDFHVAESTAYQQINKAVNLKPVTFGTASVQAPCDEQTAMVEPKKVVKEEPKKVVKEEPKEMVKEEPKKVDMKAPTAEEFNKDPKFVQFFDYNENKVNSIDASFKTFISNAVELFKVKGTINIMMEASASRVPTKTYGTNETLSSLRMNKCRDAIVKALEAEGISNAQIGFGSTATLVQGPQYNGDFKTNKETYAKFQYVKVIAR